MNLCTTTNIPDLLSAYVQGKKFLPQPQQQQDEQQQINPLITQQFSSFSISLLNLARNWVTSLLPHTISKIDRVHFGLMQHRDIIRWIAVYGSGKLLILFFVLIFIFLFLYLKIKVAETEIWPHCQQMDPDNY